MKSTQLLGVHFLRLVCLGLCTAWAAPVPLLAQNVAEEPVVTQLKVFRLKYAPAVEVMQNIRSVQQGQADGVVQLATDSRTNSLIARAPQQVLEEIEALVKILDTETPDERAGELQIRLVWLVGGLADDAAAIPPPDLENVTRELEKMGVTNLTMAAQLVVNVTAGEKFSVSGTAKVNEPCALQVAGLLDRKSLERPPAGTSADESWLRLEISAHVTGGEQRQPLCTLQTTAKAPIGQSVVLGITPVQSKPSVFVLQLRRRASSDN
jgi:hypothetical protein